MLLALQEVRDTPQWGMRTILLLVFFGFIANLTAVVNRPRGDEVNIKLEINGKERIYYELDEDGLNYKNIGKQFNSGDSIKENC